MSKIHTIKMNKNNDPKRTMSKKAKNKRRNNMDMPTFAKKYLPQYPPHLYVEDDCSCLCSNFYICDCDVYTRYEYDPVVHDNYEDYINTGNLPIDIKHVTSVKFIEQVSIKPSLKHLEFVCFCCNKTHFHNNKKSVMQMTLPCWHEVHTLCWKNNNLTKCMICSTKPKIHKIIKWNKIDDRPMSKIMTIVHNKINVNVLTNIIMQYLSI